VAVVLIAVLLILILMLGVMKARSDRKSELELSGDRYHNL
jgi:hypothetical protein